jgi:mRNA interferase HicA
MKRRELMKRLEDIAKGKGATMTVTEGGSHTKVRFDGEVVTLVGRHNEVPERTARGSLKTAEQCTKGTA